MSKGYIIEYEEKKILVPEYLLLEAVKAFEAARITIKSVISTDMDSYTDLPVLDKNTFGYYIGYLDDAGKEAKVFAPEEKLQAMYEVMRELGLNPHLLSWTNQIIG